MAQTSAETGLPGRPSTGTAPSLPNSSGFPGRMAICQKSSFRPRAVRPSITRSWSPTRAAAGGHQHVHAVHRVRHRGHRLAVSAATGSTTGAPPAARTRAASACELELTMPPGGMGSPGMAISSPVARMATRGRRWTVSQGWLAGGGKPDVARGQAAAGGNHASPGRNPGRRGGCGGRRSPPRSPGPRCRRRSRPPAAGWRPRPAARRCR